MRFQVWVSLFAVCAGWGQTAAPLSFEVASVKPAIPPEPGQSRSNRANVDRIDYQSASLRYCIAFAYGVKDYQISGPAWLVDGRWEIVAKGPEGTRRQQLPDMMQTLLAERFKLEVHRETKEFPGLALVVGKNGPKLKPAAAPSPGGRGGYRMSMMFGRGGKLDAEAMSMPALADAISNLLGRPVANLTELAGEYAISLEYTSDETQGGTAIRVSGPPPAASDAEPGVSIFTAIQALGLKLESRKFPLEVIVVDHMERTPTGN